MDPATKARIINNVINRLDPCKDAAEGGILKQSNDDHKSKVLNGIDALFGPPLAPPTDMLPTLDTTVIGDTKNAMWARISAEYGTVPMLRNRQQLMRLKSSPTGVDNRYTGMYVAHDAGLAPAGLFSTDYRLVITPGSILDPAAKVKARGQIDETTSLTVANNFPFESLGQIAMGRAIPGPIQFASAGDEYSFQIPTVAGPVNASFDNQYQTESAYFAGNYTKNSYIASPGATPEEIQKYILAKEIGDTLQVCWLKEILGTSALKPADMNLTNTAIMSCDKVVWFRSIVNNISTFLSSKNTVTYYPAMDDATYLRTMKQKLATDLKNNNEAVILMINNLLLAMTIDTDATFEGMEIDTNNTKAENFLLELVARLESVATYINTYIRSPPMINEASMEAFTAAVAALTMCCPIVKKGDAYKFSRVFKRFLPYNNLLPEIGVLPFNPQHMWAAHRNGMTETAIVNSLNGIPEMRPAPMPVQAGGDRSVVYEPNLNPNPYSEADLEYMNELLQENRDVEGFKAHFMLTFFPEILYIGLASYSKTTLDSTEIRRILTSGPELESLTDRFDSPDVGYRYVAAEPNPLFALYDTYAATLCNYARHVINTTFSEQNQYTTFINAVYGPVARYPMYLDADMRWDIYQFMYYGDLIATLRNVQDVDGYNPLSFVEGESDATGRIPDLEIDERRIGGKAKRNTNTNVTRKIAKRFKNAYSVPPNLHRTIRFSLGANGRSVPVYGGSPVTGGGAGGPPFGGNMWGGARRVHKRYPKTRKANKQTVAARRRRTIRRRK